MNSVYMNMARPLSFRCAWVCAKYVLVSADAIKPFHDFKYPQRFGLTNCGCSMNARECPVALIQRTSCILEVSVVNSHCSYWKFEPTKLPRCCTCVTASWCVISCNLRNHVYTVDREVRLHHLYMFLLTHSV